MADESQYPFWGRLSAEVKVLLTQARRWSLQAKKPRVICDHIMSALVSSYAEEVKMKIERLSNNGLV